MVLLSFMRIRAFQPVITTIRIFVVELDLILEVESTTIIDNRGTALGKILVARARVVKKRKMLVEF